MTDWYYPAFKAGGPITSIYNLVKLLKDDYNFHIVTGDKDLGSNESLEGIEINQWVKGKNGEYILYLPDGKLNRPKFNNIIELTNPNILFLNSLFSVNFTIKPLLFSRNLDVPVYLSPRGMLHPQAFSQKKFKKSLFVRLLQLYPAYRRVKMLATNKTEQSHIIAASFKNKVHIVPNIPDLELLEKPAKTEKRPIIAIVSRVAEEKNSLFAIEVLNKMKTKVTVHWIGDSVNPDYFQHFKQQVGLLPTSIDFEFHGGQSKRFIHQILDESSFFFLPTLGENFGHAIFEALAAGCPSVIGENTPFRQIEDYKCGALVNLKDVKNTAEILDQHISMPLENFKTYSLNAQRFALEIFQAAEAKAAYKSIW